MDQLVDRLIAFVSQENNPIGLGILALSAFVEYVFPPLPGDTITLFGAFLITAKGWSFVAVFLSVLAGSTLGAWADFSFGRWIQKRSKTRPSRHPEARAKIDRLVARFEKHGEVYIVLNRFLPGVRALFFVAAGMANMRLRYVLLWATVSAALWNLILILIGSSVGANFEELKRFFVGYSRIVWIVVGVVVAALVVRWAVKRARARAAPAAAVADVPPAEPPVPPVP